MKFEFNSITELEEFVHFLFTTRNVGSQPEPQPATGVLLDAQLLVHGRASHESAESVVGAGGGTSPQDNADEPEAKSTDTPAPTGGRKPRKTKAEKDAEAAAAAGGSQGGASGTGEPPVTFDHSNADTQAERVASVVADPQPLDNLKPETPTTPTASSAAPSDVEHLKLCRNFIALHGVGTYEKSFAAAGLEGKNIMAFTDADRANHVKALDALAAA